MKLNCAVVNDLYVLYEENELCTEVRGYVDEHLQECEKCRKVYESGTSLQDALEEKLPEPPKKLDERLLLRLKLSRIKKVLVFMLIIICVTSYGWYSQRRERIGSFLVDFGNQVSMYYNFINELHHNKDMQESNLDINRKLEQHTYTANYKYNEAIRRFLLLENPKIWIDHSRYSFNPEVNTLILTLHNRNQAGYFSDKDAEVYNLLLEELDKIRKLAYKDNDRVKKKLFVRNTGKLRDSFDYINRLAETYITYNMLPEDIELFTKKELKERISYILGTRLKDIKLTKTSDFLYTFETFNEGHEATFGKIDAVNGRILSMISKPKELEDGSIEIEGAKEVIRDFILQNFGRDFDVSIEYRDLDDYDFSHYSRIEPKPYAFDVYLTFMDYKFFDYYNVIIDSRDNNTLNFTSNPQDTPLFTADVKKLKPNVIYTPEDALNNITSPDIIGEYFEYIDTYYIKSMYSGEYVLAHYYEDINNSESSFRSLLINAETGREELPSYTKYSSPY